MSGCLGFMVFSDGGWFAGERADALSSHHVTPGAPRLRSRLLRAVSFSGPEIYASLTRASGLNPGRIVSVLHSLRIVLHYVHHRHVLYAGVTPPPIRARGPLTVQDFS